MGIHKQFGQRNAPTVLNATFNILQFWDGRAADAGGPGQGPDPQSDRDGDEELRRVVAKVKAIPEYQKQFKEVFGGADHDGRFREGDRRL